MTLNDEGNSSAANSTYGGLMEFLLKSSRYYQKGTSMYLDSVLAQIPPSNLRLYDDVIRRANNIAHNDTLSNKKKRDAYNSLAEWVLLNQNDL